MNLGTLTVTLGVDATALAGATTSMSKSINNISQKFRTFGYLASATVTAPIVMAGKASLDLAKNYEFAMQKIVGLTGVAQSSVNKWSDEILKMGPSIAKGPQELADALYFISSSGIKGAEAMNVLKLSAKASASGLGDTKDVADLLTSALNAYKGTGLTAAYATDVLVAAVREGKAEASGFSSAMGQIIPIASQLGVSFDQVAGGMAAITLTGSSSSQAAVYLKGVFNSLLKATTQGEAALRKTGNSYAGLRKILGEQGVIPLMQRLRDIQVKYGDELLSDVLPNIRALTGYLSLAGKNFKYNTELMNRVTNASGSLAKSFAAVSDTIKFRYDAAIAQAQTSLISLGKSIATAFLPLLDSLVKALGKVTDRFNDLSDAQKENRLKWVAFIALLGPASLLISVLGYGISGLIKIFKTLGTIISVVNVGLDAMGFKILKLGALKLTNLKSGILSVLGFLGESGAAAMTAGVGIAVGGATIAVTKYAKKVKELAKEHDLYYTTLVNVNGELKKLKDLTETDVEAMTKQQAAVAMDQVRKAWIAAEAGWKQREKNKSLPMVNQKENLKQQVEYARQIAEYSKLYDELLNAYLLGDMDKFSTLQKNITKNFEDQKVAAENLKKELAAINKWYLDRYNDSMKKAGENKQTPFTGFPDMRMFFMRTSTFTAGLPTLEETNKAMERTKVLASELTQIFSDMFMTIGEGWSKFIDSIVQGIKKLVAEIMARVVVFAILSIISGGTSTLALGAKGLIKGGFGNFLFKGLGRGMANGGVVPPGFPNDSYPARLTSGETVLPPNKLDNLSRAQTIKVKVDGEIKGSGRDLAVIIRRAMQYN
jgi:TP901 family phage tail tape measure protein